MYESEFGLFPYAIGTVPTFVNTVNLSDVFVEFRYYNMSNQLRSHTTRLDSSGHFTISRPDDYSSPYLILFRLKSDNLPSFGTYDFQLRMGSDTNLVYEYGSLFTDQHNYQVAEIMHQVKLSGSDFQQAGGDVYFHSVIDLGRVNKLEAVAYFDRSSTVNFNIGGDVKVRLVWSGTPGISKTSRTTPAITSSSSGTTTTQSISSRSPST